MEARTKIEIQDREIVGLEVAISRSCNATVPFETVGLAGEVELSSGKIEPLYVFIGSTESVRKWLNRFGGLDIIEYVRYDKYAELLERVRELEKVNEELRFKLADKVEEIKKLHIRIKELNEKIDELELELAGKEIPVV